MESGRTTETAAPRSPKHWVTRRRFLSAAGAIAASGFGLGVYTWLIEPHWVEVVRVDMPLPNLPAALAGRTLLHITDLHVGPIVDSDYLAASLRLASSLRPDLVAITGDFMSCKGSEQVDNVARVLEHLAPAPLGTFAALGNHDYGRGWSRSEVAERLCGRLGDLGIQVLRNRRCSVAGLQLAGLDDFWGPCFQPEKLLPNLDPKAPGIVLCHNPDAVDLPGWTDFKGWVLSGHTHGGQCKPPFLPPPQLPVRNKRYTAGVFDLFDGRTLYINPGLGYLRKVRFNVRPEITLFRLQSA